MKDLFIIELFKEWLKDKYGLKASTRYIYGQNIYRFKGLGYNFSNSEDYNNYIIEYEIKRRITTIYKSVKRFVEFYFRDEKNVKNDLLDKIIIPEQKVDYKYKRKYLSESEILEVINALKDFKHKVISLIQHLTGVRAGDVMHIKRGMIEPEIYDGKNVVKITLVGKGDKRNVVYLHEVITQKLLMDYITKYINNLKYYFLDIKSKRFKNTDDESQEQYYLMQSNIKAYRRDLKQALYKCGIEQEAFSTHDYRRCYARRVWTKYKDLVVLKDMLNHADPSTTLLYLKQSGLKNIEYHKQLQTE